MSTVARHGTEHSTLSAVWLGNGRGEGGRVARQAATSVICVTPRAGSEAQSCRY